jgi:hypothetical protein
MKQIIATIALALSVLTTTLHGTIGDYVVEQITAYITPLAHQVLLSNAVYAQLHFIGYGATAQIMKMHNIDTHRMEHAIGALLSTTGGALSAITPAYLATRTFSIQTDPCGTLTSTLLKRGACAGLLAYETGRLATYSLTHAARLTTPSVIRALPKIQTAAASLKTSVCNSSILTNLKKYFSFFPTDTRTH